MPKIVICASVKREEKIKEYKNKLEEAGFEVIKYPQRIESNNFLSTYETEFKSHYESISEADAILALNYNQKGISGYVGAGTFAEMAFALGLNKNIEVFYSHPLPEEDTPYSDELNWWKELGWIKRINL